MRARSLFIILSVLSGCGEPQGDYHQGYVEGKYLHPAPALGGRLMILGAREGQRVRQGEMLFALDAGLEEAALHEAELRADAARARFDDLNKGRRSEEIEVLRAAHRDAEAALSLATVELKRASELFAQRIIPRSELDTAETMERRVRARLQQAGAELRVAELAARDDQIAAANAEVEAAAAAVAQARWALDQKAVTAPAEGVVEAVYHRPGEWVPAGSPVLRLLPDSGRVIRFFVPEADLAAQRIGLVRRVSCDGCPAGLTATVNFISPEAEFTPPVIYSRHQREKLVFMLEAAINGDGASVLHPGMPVEISDGE